MQLHRQVDVSETCFMSLFVRWKESDSQEHSKARALIGTIVARAFATEAGMVTIIIPRRITHCVRRDGLYYDIEVFRQKSGCRATWACLFCHASRELTAATIGDAEEQAFASVDAHHFVFSQLVSSRSHPSWLGTIQ